MKNFLNAAGAAAGLIAATAIPASAQPVQPSGAQHYVLQTAIANERRAGEIDGVLDITVYPDGIVQGTYRDADQGLAQTVAGGEQGDSIWFDVGPLGRLHAVGTLRDGVLRTVVQSPGPDTVTFNSIGAPKR
jgi:hypothetical protein